MKENIQDLLRLYIKIKNREIKVSFFSRENK